MADGGWDERSDSKMIIIHPTTGDRESRQEVYRIPDELKQQYYPSYRDYGSPHPGVSPEQMTVPPVLPFP